MNLKYLISCLASLLLGMAIMLAISLYLISNRVVDDITQALHISVYNYEMAVEQENRQDILDRLNSQISCALNSITLIGDDKSHLKVDKSYEPLITKAKNLSYTNCDYPNAESLVVKK